MYDVLPITATTVEDVQRENERIRKFYASLIMGRPQATEKYTVEELEEMGYKGYYREEE
jgi:hypothetical protein